MHVIDLDVESGTRIGLCLVKKVKNVASLRKRILSGELNCCAIKPSLVVHPLQVVAAANKAALNKKLGKLTTKNLNSELLFNLSPSKNITQSLTTFGLADDDENLLMVVFDEAGDVDFSCVQSEVDGEDCSLNSLTDIAAFSDSSLIKKVYKITDEELGVSTLANSVISRVATKEFGS